MVYFAVSPAVVATGASISREISAITLVFPAVAPPTSTVMS
jgi:hypothetical protein